MLPIPELDTEIAAIRGFNVIATANDRDRGVNDLSSALRRRFNTVVLPLPCHDRRGDRHRQPPRRRTRRGTRTARRAGRGRRDPPCRHGVPRTALRRSPRTQRNSVKIPTGTLSTAEAISVVTNGIALAAHFGDGELRSTDVAAGIIGAVVSDPVHDAVAWREYLEAVVRERPGWDDFYNACRALDT